MEIVRFIFWTAMKTLAVVFLGLLAVKSVGSLRRGEEGLGTGRALAIRGILYGIILLLAILSAWNLGYDIAAEVYATASQRNLARREVKNAYANALRAVELRPGNLRYWQLLAASKLALHQFASLIDDLPVYQALSAGKLEEEDRYRFASAYYFQGEYDKVIPLTRQMIAENPMYAAPYVLQGYAYTAQKDFAQAERTFLTVLRMFPTQQSAVEGLAHLYFIGGNKAGALSILEQTKKFPFPPESRRRFEALKALYAQ
jgi:tetratricopeptide (TPR) repeat protein